MQIRNEDPEEKQIMTTDISSNLLLLEALIRVCT